MNRRSGPPVSRAESKYRSASDHCSTGTSSLQIVRGPRGRVFVLFFLTRASHRNDRYEATLLVEAVALQWFSLAFVQSHDALVQSVNALQRVIELGFYLEEASRRLGAVLLRQRQRDASK